MRFFGVHLFVLSLFFLSSGCLKDGEVSVDDLSNIKAQVFKVENQNGKLVIEGQNLNATQKVRIKGSSLDNELVIQSKSKTRIVAALSQALTLTASAVYELVLSNAYGQSVYQLSFEIQDGQVTTVKLADDAVTGDKIADMGARSGQVLKYNGTTWDAADLNSLVYAGTWDASTGTEPASAPVGGDFWIVDTDGDVDLGDGNGIRQWRIGDWIVYNSFTGQWDQVISSQSVVSFNGRAGEVDPEQDDYTWQQIDKTLAPIGDLTDVDTTTSPPANGEVLKWDGSNWTPQVDENDGGDITSVNAGTGLLGGATSGDADLDIDVGTGANQIPQLDASGLVLNSVIPGLDTSKITSGTMNTTRLPYASSTTDGIISSSDYQTFSNTDTTLSNGATGEYLDGDGNWYVLDKAAVGLGNVTNDEQIPASSLDTNTALGISDTLVPSQNAVKSYVDSSVSTASNDYLLRDGTQAMTGDFDAGANNLTNINNTEISNELRFIDDGGTNYVALKSRPTVSSNQTWLLPASDGGPGQVLSTDGTGNLSWTSSGDGSVTNVTATLPIESSGGTTPDISMALSNSTTDGYLSSADWNTFNSKEDALGTGAANQYLDENKSWQNLNTDAVIEGSNLYYTTARARADAVENQIVDGVTDRAPSQNVVFDELATKADQASLSNYVLKGGDTMTGALNLPANGLTVGTNQIVTSGGNVGLGAAAPDQSLVVGGDMRVTGNTILGATDDSFVELDDDTGVSTNAVSVGSLTNASVILDTNNNNVGNFFSVRKDGPREGTSTELFRVNDTGQVGVSNTNPLSLLDVRVGSAYNSAIAISENGSDGFLLGGDLAPGGALNRFFIGRTDYTLGDGATPSSPTELFSLTAGGNVGIGTTTPTEKLQVDGDMRLGNVNPADGADSAGYGNKLYFSGGPGQATRDSENSDPLWMARYNITNDQSELRVNIGDNNSAVDAFVIGHTSGGWSPVMRVEQGGSVVVNGSTVHTSDARLKERILPLENSLDKVLDLNGVRYFWADPKRNSDEEIGVIAQDVEKAFPQLVRKDRKTGYLSVNYAGLVSPVIEAIKEQQEQIEKNREAYRMMKDGSARNSRRIASLASENVKLNSKISKQQEQIKELQSKNKKMEDYLCKKFSEASFCQ